MNLDLDKYKEAFLREAKTYIDTMNFALVNLEKDPDQKREFQQIFTALHTLKSMATVMRYDKSAYLCHSFEDLLDAVSNEKVTLQSCIDSMFQCVDHLSHNIQQLENDKSELSSDHLISQLNAIYKNKTNPHKDTPQEIIVSTLPGTKTQAIEVKVTRLDKLMNLSEEILICKMKFDSMREEIEHPEFITSIDKLGRIITDLQYHIMQARLTPIEFVFKRFIRVARDIAKQFGKEVDLHFESGDIELDRLLIDEIGESIAHLIRNAIFHGIETPDVRRDAKKSLAGKIMLRARRSRENVVIEMSDDGAGIDINAIKSVAMEKHLIKADVNPTDLINMIFTGLSTTRCITEVSGRGLGLAIVKQKIESIGGNIRVETTPGINTTFFLEIPLTLAIIKTLFVKVGAEIYAIPIEFIERLLIVTPDDIKGMLSSEAIINEGKDIPIIRLSTLFNQESAPQTKQPIVIIQKGDMRVGMVVDNLISTQEVVIKPLNRSIKDNKFVSGVALIGSGHMVLKYLKCLVSRPSVRCLE